ncbi:uncharacterized protein LOC144105726 isoform X2 [Amblyomma americanum]
MKAEFFLLCIIIVIIGNSYGAYNYHPGTTFCYLDPRNRPLLSCYSQCYLTGGRYYFVVHRNGIPCFFNKYGRWTRGQCSEGVCTDQPNPRPRPCDNVYRGEGYASNCSYVCSQGSYRTHLVHYRDKTACIHTNEKGQPIGSPGVCKAGKCITYDELGESQLWAAAQRIFGQKYHKCESKENYAKIVLQDCRHYCKTDAGLFFGYYGSGYNNACFLFDRADPHRQGWCCRGKCNKEAHCQGAYTRRSE